MHTQTLILTHTHTYIHTYIQTTLSNLQTHTDARAYAKAIQKTLMACVDRSNQFLGSAAPFCASSKSVAEDVSWTVTRPAQYVNGLPLSNT